MLITVNSKWIDQSSIGIDIENNFILVIDMAMNHDHFRLTQSVQYREDQDSKPLLPSKTLVLQSL